MIAEAIEHWRKCWKYQQRKHARGPHDDDAWREYVNGLTMFEVIEALECHGDIVQYQEK